MLIYFCWWLNFRSISKISLFALIRINLFEKLSISNSLPLFTFFVLLFKSFVDNAYDPDVKASQLYIDAPGYATNDTTPLTLTFTDNGNGMVPETMYKMLRYVILCTLDTIWKVLQNKTSCLKQQKKKWLPITKRWAKFS